MTTTLTRTPLRTSQSFTKGHFGAPEGISDSGDKPFGYRFANWNPREARPEDEILGSFDTDSQTWRTPTGAITMGIGTYTRTGGGSMCGDCVRDDTCG